MPAILDDPRVQAVTLTGSDRAGRDVASRAGRALKKSVLELGGSDPFIVTPSADLDAGGGHRGQVAHCSTADSPASPPSGSSCRGGRRRVHCGGSSAAMAALKVGDPLDPSTELGPMASADLVEALTAQVQRRRRARRARCSPAARRSTGRATTIRRRCSPTFRETRAGLPRGAVRTGRDGLSREGFDEAIALANDTPYGLGASVWTNDAAERDRFVAALEAGQVFVNAMVASDPRVPFGGVKHVGLRPRARSPRHPRVHEHQDGVGSLREGYARRSPADATAISRAR